MFGFLKKKPFRTNCLGYQFFAFTWHLRYKSLLRHISSSAMSSVMIFICTLTFPLFLKPCANHFATFSRSYVQNCNKLGISVKTTLQPFTFSSRRSDELLSIAISHPREARPCVGILHLFCNRCSTTPSLRSPYCPILLLQKFNHHQKQKNDFFIGSK